MAIHTEVLVIGGGFAGVSAAQKLAKNGVNTLLIDKKDYFEVTFATLRNLADPDATGDQARKRYQDFIGGDFVQGEVVTMDTQSARLADDTIIHFERAIIASGTRYPGMPAAKTHTALDIAARNQEFTQMHKNLRQANKVMVIGGGVVGVELAGEIAHAMPDADVVLAHGGDVLLPGFKAKAQLKARQQLEALGVEILFNRLYQRTDGRYIDQNSGDISDADLVYEATGVVPNNEFLKTDLSYILNSHGFVKVDASLRVEGAPNLYALGDIADVGEARLGYLAVQQGEYLADAIIKLSQKKNIKGYKRNSLMALIPVGAKQGVVQLPFAVTTANVLVNIKQKDLFINKIYKGFGTSPDVAA